MRCALVLAFSVCCCTPAAQRDRDPTIVTNTSPPKPRSDLDRDDIADDIDRCIDEPEDYDVWLDDDGCPDPDDDGDGVLDLEDRCPYHPGPPDTGCAAGCTPVIANAECVLAPIYAIDGGNQGEQLRAFIADIASFPEIQEVMLSSSRFGMEQPGQQMARVEPLRAQLIALGWPSRVALVVRTRGHYPDRTMAKMVFAEVSKQRFELNQFRETVCSAAGAVYRLARANYQCARTP